MYKFIDLHCDTITRCFEERKELYENDINIDIKRLNSFKNSIQVFAIWLLDKYKKDAFNNTKLILDFFDEEIEKNKNYIKKIQNIKSIEDGKLGAILSLEGLESIEDNLDNIDYFYSRGVKIMGLCWNYENLLGYGALEDRKLGLKPFGKEAIKKMQEKNIIIDVSHLNEAGFWDLYNIAKAPFIASHSNSYTICNSVRNLKDEQLKAIRDIRGLIGINLYPNFLTNNKVACIDDILRHIDYMGRIVGEDILCLGSDFDGIDKMPEEISDICGYNTLFYRIEKAFGKQVMEKIVYKNAQIFFKKYL